MFRREVKMCLGGEVTCDFLTVSAPELKQNITKHHNLFLRHDLKLETETVCGVLLNAV